jgi:hypothetical protein
MNSHVIKQELTTAVYLNAKVPRCSATLINKIQPHLSAILARIWMNSHVIKQELTTAVYLNAKVLRWSATLINRIEPTWLFWLSCYKESKSTALL